MDIGSGTLLKGGRVLTAAHVVSSTAWITGGGTVLIATYSGDDEQPPQWAYEAQVLTPNDVLNRKTLGILTDLAVLQITGTVACVPGRSCGKAHFSGTPEQPTPVGIAITERNPLSRAALARLPSLALVPDMSELGSGDAVTVIAYAAAAGTNIFVSTEQVVTVEHGYLKTRAYIHSGSSGGPLLDTKGRVLSVVSHGGGIQRDPQGRVISDVPELAHTRLVTMLTKQHFGASEEDSESEEEDESKSGPAVRIVVITPSPVSAVVVV
jgi:hypothetical protein